METGEAAGGGIRIYSACPRFLDQMDRIQQDFELFARYIGHLRCDIDDRSILLIGCLCNHRGLGIADLSRIERVAV